MTAPRPLSLATHLVLLALTGAGLELGVRSAYSAQTPMLDKAVAYAAAADGEGEDLVIMGTCLPEQIIQRDLLARALGPQVEVHNLATQAGSTLLWQLVLTRYLPADVPIQAILIPYGARDLTNQMDPWESQVQDLATWRDIPLMVEVSCQDADCALGVAMSQLSEAWRYRGRLANSFWRAMGARGDQPSDEAPLPEGPAGEGPSGGDAPPPPLPTERAPDDPGHPGGGPGQPPGQPAQRAPDDPGLSGGGGAEGEDAMDAIGFERLARFLQAAEDRGLRVIFTPLPRRPSDASASPPTEVERAYDARIRETIAAGGGDHLELGEIVGLGDHHFTDDVHLNDEGRRVVSEALGAALRRHFQGG